MAEDYGNDIEKAAIEIEILKAEDVLIAEPAGIIVDYQLAVVMLHAFVIRDGIVAERVQCDHNEGREKKCGSEVKAVERSDEATKAAIDLRNP